VVFKFDKPMRNLPDIISTPTYAIVSSKDYDPVTKKWRNPKHITASGPYRISAWSDESLELRRRTEVVNHEFHHKMLDKIKFAWNLSEKYSSDIVLAHSISGGFPDSYSFFGGPVSGVAYLRCHSWKLPASVCGQLISRRAARNSFYRAMESAGHKISTQFFLVDGPSPTRDYTPDTSSPFDNTRHKSLTILKSHTNLNPYFSSYVDALSKAAGELHIPVEPKDVSSAEVMRYNNPDLPVYQIEISARATDIDFGSLKRDLEMMFLSLEGLRLPDTDGRIRQEIENDKPDLQRINQIIWEQAAIWPMAHFSQGVFAKKSLFDMSQLNLLLPPLELQWIGWR